MSASRSGKPCQPYASSLREYVLVSQEEPLVEHYTRADDGSRVLRTFSAAQLVRLPSLDIELAVDALYAGIDLTRSVSL